MTNAGGGIPRKFWIVTAMYEEFLDLCKFLGWKSVATSQLAVTPHILLPSNHGVTLAAWINPDDVESISDFRAAMQQPRGRDVLFLIGNWSVRNNLTPIEAEMSAHFFGSDIIKHPRTPRDEPIFWLEDEGNGER
jgi:hypothetical protein